MNGAKPMYGGAGQIRSIRHANDSVGSNPVGVHYMMTGNKMSFKI